MRIASAFLAVLVAALAASPVARAQTLVEVRERPIQDYMEAAPLPDYPCDPFVLPQLASWNWVNADWYVAMDHHPVAHPIRYPKFVGDLTAEDLAHLDEISTYDGEIIERVFDDGSAELRITIEVTNMSLNVYRLDDLPGGTCDPDVFPPLTILGAGEDGTIDTVYDVVWRVPVAGAPIPHSADVEGVGGVRIREQIHGVGHGIFTEHAADFGFTPRASGTVILMQTWIRGPAGRHPGKTAPGLDRQFEFPAEVIRVMEVGQ